MAVHEEDPGRKKSQKSIKSSVTLFGVQYNFVVISVIEALFVYEIYGSLDTEIYSWLDGTILGGSIVGMVMCGFLGDSLGRSNTFVLALTGTALSTLACGVLSWGPKRVVLLVIIITRFFVGVGIGGSMPLSGVEAYEEGGADATAQSFAFMCIGQIVPYLIGYILSFLPPISETYSFSTTINKASIQIQLHLLILIGMIPALKILPQALCDDDEVEIKTMGRSSFSEVLGELKRDWIKTVTLTGIMSCCFIYDMTAYYIGLYSSTILDWVFNNTDTFRVNMVQNILASAVCLPAAALSLIILKRNILSSSSAAILGLIISGTLFCFFAYAYSANYSTYFLFVTFLMLRASTWFLTVFGLFIFPNEVFPVEIRATCSGISAASGKVGALFGVMVIPNLGMSTVKRFYFLGAACFVGVVVSGICFKSALKTQNSNTHETRRLVID